MRDWLHSGPCPERGRFFSRTFSLFSTRSFQAVLSAPVIHPHSPRPGEYGDFIAMEYISGKPLNRLIKYKGLQTSQVICYAVPLADGLAFVHNAGVIHGDLKPANIIINEEGELKILDFGFAKLKIPKGWMQMSAPMSSRSARSCTK